MKSILKVLLIGMTCNFMTGCASAVLSSLNPDLTSPFDQSSGPRQAIHIVSPKGSMTSSQTCAHNVLGLVAWGDASLETAAKNADIVTINSVSFEKFSLLFIVYNEFCTHVAGHMRG